MPVYILMIHVKPNDNNPKAEEIAGAYVNCCVEAENFKEAENIAIKYLRGEHWMPIELEETYEVSEKDYVNDEKGLEVYKQVLIDKVKFSFHTYETEDEE